MQTAMKQAERADCEPTLTDTDVVEFCKQGFLMLEGVVPDEINQRVLDFVDANGHIPIRGEDWFVEHVLLNREAAGAVRSLIGANFAVPIGVANHRIKCPMPAQEWHQDGGSRVGPAVNNLQVFYYPQDAPPELGPTEVLPGSHHLASHQRWMQHYGSVRGTVHTAAPAGSIFITAYPIWHRRSKSTAQGMRNMLKYCYWRMEPPRRDWIVDPDFDFAMAPYALDGTLRHWSQFRDWYEAAEMFFWLCGDPGKMTEAVGGTGWPIGHPPPRMGEQIYPPVGFRRFPEHG